VEQFDTHLKEAWRRHSRNYKNNGGTNSLIWAWELDFSKSQWQKNKSCGDEIFEVTVTEGLLQ